MIKKHLIFNFILTISLFMTSNDVKSQEKDSTINQKIYKNSIELSPISPVMRIYAIQYSHQILQRGEMLFGLAYMNIHYDMGNINAPAIILGYRQYFWSKLYIEYQIWPTYDKFFEKNEKNIIRVLISGMNLELVINSILQYLKCHFLLVLNGHLVLLYMQAINRRVSRILKKRMIIDFSTKQFWFLSV